jgi:glycosyltransferase involved in cell wall biosynthesis
MSAQAERPGSHIAVVIPAYNEERTIAGVIRGLKAIGYSRILVVDDGSKDRTSELAREAGALVIRHVVNRGLGGALGTGLKAALLFTPEIILTFDADGQHDPDEIAHIIEPIEKGEADVVIGSRLSDPKGMPWSRRVANQVADLVTLLLFGLWVSDTQSGLRAFSRSAAARIRIMTSGMETSSEIIAEIGRNKLRLKEVPIKAIYTEYSLSKGQSFKLGLYTLTKLILAKIRRSKQ